MMPGTSDLIDDKVGSDTHARQITHVRVNDDENTSRIELAIAGLEEPGRPMRWKRASFDERATPRSGF